MPWTTDKPPKVATNWTDAEIGRCVNAANTTLEDGGTDEEAIFACIGAAGKEVEDMDKMERKRFSFELTKLDVEGRTLEGYAAAFNNIDRVDDIIHPGAFTKTIAERGQKVKFLWMHDPTEPIGRPLTMQEDNKGLFIRAVISDTRRGRDTLALLKDDAIDTMSIGYDPITFDFTKKSDKTIRNLREVRLHEFSLVTFAANEEATVTALKEDDEKQDTEPIVPPEQGHVCECSECDATITTTTPCDELECSECGGNMKETVAAVGPAKEDSPPLELKPKEDEGPEDIKIGRVLSSKNRTLISRCVKEMGEAAAALQALLEATEPPAREKDLSTPDEIQVVLEDKEVEQKQTDSNEAEPDQPLTSVEDLRQALMMGVLSLELELMEVD